MFKQQHYEIIFIILIPAHQFQLLYPAYVKENVYGQLWCVYLPKYLGSPSNDPLLDSLSSKIKSTGCFLRTRDWREEVSLDIKANNATKVQSNMTLTKTWLF